MSDAAQAIDLERPPPGISLDVSGPDGFVIWHRRKGMGCMTFFLLVWLAGWTVACVMLASGAFKSPEDLSDAMSLLFALPFWAAEVVVGALVLYMLFCRKAFRVDKEALVIDTKVLLYHRERRIPWASITRLVQVQDGGQGDDSFPSWGLKAEGAEKVTLLFRQPRESSLWLGSILARWSGLPFVEAPADK